MTTRHWIPALLALLALSAFPSGSARGAGDRELLALHWHPATAETARRRTVAAAAWLQHDQGLTGDWRGGIASESLMLERAARRVAPETASPADGLFAWLVSVRDHNLAGMPRVLPLPSLDSAGDLTRRPGSAGRLARLYRVAAIEAPAIWARVRDRLHRAGIEDGEAAVAEYWQPLVDRMNAEAPDLDAHRGHARRQAEHVLAPAGEESGQMHGLVFDQARFQWAEGRVLEAMWLVLEGLIRTAQLEQPAAAAGAYREWLGRIDEEQRRELRRIDIDLPVILALFEDAAAHLADPDARVVPALIELGDVYARLALFAPDMAFYLDQPVRSDVRQAIERCNPDPLLVGPLPRDVFERCLEKLVAVIDSGLDSEELVGGRQGPFAREFLRRELGLVSWQRAAYLDGHLAWMLDAPCQPPEWFNVLEWSTLVEHLARWVEQRPVFFVATRWQQVLDGFGRRVREKSRMHADWIDCVTGQGRERRDPVVRLIERQERALDRIEQALEAADRDYYRRHTRTGADIALDGPADQVTGYRPESLVIGPCAGAETCGARVQLPASRALLGLFPNVYLLADQIGLGTIGLCYDNVRWVKRTMTPARGDRSNVANFHGRLAFDLVGDFRGEQQAETVFRRRLVDEQLRHYLFSEANPELLESACPHQHIGEPIASELGGKRVALVPDRLTYFTSAPTTADAQLQANWTRGAEWRDWFVTGERIELLESTDGDHLELAVQAQLAALAVERERQLSAPLIRPARRDETDPAARAMAEVSASAAMLRRILEIHYPRVIRHDDDVRALVSGSESLISRDRVRMLRDGGVPTRQVPDIGQARLERLRDHWLSLPAELREQGQPAPELDFGHERLELLRRLGRDPSNAAAAGEGP